MANTTAMARGVKRYFAGPVRNTTGTKTMQIDKVETKAGVAICCAPEERLIEELLDLEARRRGGADAREERLELLDDREGRSAALLDHGEQHRPAAVLPDHVGLDREAVAHVRHVAQVDRGAVDDLDGQVVERGD